MRRENKAISTLLLILIILVSLVAGALISYLWAIAPFYKVADQLMITDVNFPVDHATYFNVTIMNPSNSEGATNITDISLYGEGQAEPLNITSVSPSLPLPLDRGVSQTIGCQALWGDFAGKALTVHLTALNSIQAVFDAHPQYVNLTADTYFNATESVQYFNITVRNDPNSAINLTLTQVSLDFEPVSSLTITLPRTLAKSDYVTFRCFSDWETHPKPIVTVETQEGYTAQVRKEVNSSVLLTTNDVSFDETNSNRINVTLSNSADSATLVDVTNITIAHINGTDIINGTMSSPNLPYRLDTNSTVTFNCVWNWADQSFRNTVINITAYTSQGFASQPRVIATPNDVNGRIDQATFNLSDTSHFLLNITNLAYSLQSINITEVRLNQNLTSMTPTLIAPGTQVVLTCNLSDLPDFLGHNVMITANFTYGESGSSVLSLYNVMVPYFEITNVTFDTFSLGNPYMNVTVHNSELSKINATITQVYVKTENVTILIDGTVSNPSTSPVGYLLQKGSETTFVCPWNWSLFVGKDVTVTVQSSDGFQASTTLKV